MVDQKRHGILALTLHMDEVKRDAHQIDLELRQFVHPPFNIAPVVVFDPVADQFTVIGGVIAVFPIVIGKVIREPGAL